MLKGDKADSGTLSHRTLANDFRKEIRSQAKTGGKGYTKGSFGPTYGNQEDSRQPNQAEKSGDASNSQATPFRGSLGRKRLRKSISASSN